MSEAEDRTQAPSKRRLAQAREQGQVAHSAELTSAAGLLAAAAALGLWGEPLADALLGLWRAPASGGLPVAANIDAVAAQLRQTALALFGPLALVIAAYTLAALAAHQAQVRGLWAPALLAPDLARLWTPGRGADLGGRLRRGLWTLFKTSVIVVVAAWLLRADWSNLQRLAALDPPALARAAGSTLQHLLMIIAIAMFALGFVDFFLQTHRFETMLRLTPDQSREDMRATEGDPALRARRRRLIRSWRGDAPELLAGACLVLEGPRGLTVVLDGGPPPRKVGVRTIVDGPAGLRLRLAADKAGLPRLEAADLARRIARRKPASLPLTPDLLAEVAPRWPEPGVKPPPPHASSTETSPA